MRNKNSEAIVVLGAGPSGAVAAALLAQAGRVVILVDEQVKLNFKVGETLPADAAMALAKAGIRQVCKNIPTLPCAGNRSFWGSEILQMRSSLTNPYGCGSHLDRVAFEHALISRAMSTGAVFKPGSRLRSTVRNKNGWSLQFRSSQGFFSSECDWVLDATGRRAAFAQAQGAKRVVVDKLVAVIGVFCSSEFVDPDLTISIESAPDGWWYSAQIPCSGRIVIYFTDGDILKYSGAREERTWFQLASETQLIREFTNNPAYLLKFPLKVALADTSCLDYAAADGWLAIGDSACAIDPLSSAGITDAIKSAIDAVEVVLESKPGDKTTISDYASRVMRQHIRNNDLRIRYYHMEQRWPRSEFWARRHAG
jgi:flavin-dependent dehydrogenase